jgi:hypothetical protein
MSATIPDLHRQVVQLQQHITWLHGTLQRLGDLQPLASTIEPPRELTARVDYARAALANSLRRCAEAGRPDHPPSLAALIVGQALARPGVEQQPRQGKPAGQHDAMAVAWCDLDGTIWVGAATPKDEVELVRGQVHVLWHWIEELGEWSTHDSVSAWRVPGMARCDDLAGKADLARHFAWLLVQAGISIHTDLAAPDAPQVPA